MSKACAPLTRTVLATLVLVPAAIPSVTAAITNLTGEEPPLVVSRDANTDVASYRLLGRTSALRVGYHFY